MQLRRILAEVPVLNRHPSATLWILGRVRAVLYHPHWSRCLVCGLRLDGKAALEAHLVASCHWLSDEQGRKWV